MAKSAAERKQVQRDRDKLTEDERLARLLARRIQIDLFHRTDEQLIGMMKFSDIEEPQDFITRLIHGAARMTPGKLAMLVRRP
jgi:hypothetical protein